MLVNQKHHSTLGWLTKEKILKTPIQYWLANPSTGAIMALTVTENSLWKSNYEIKQQHQLRHFLKERLKQRENFWTMKIWDFDTTGSEPRSKMKSNYADNHCTNITCFRIVIRNGKIVCKHGPCCWYFCLNLKFVEWQYRE